MALDIVCIVLFISKTPFLKYLGIVSLTFVLAIKCFIGSPNSLATIPAQIFPKFPEGTLKTKFLLFNFLYA